MRKGLLVIALLATGGLAGCSTWFNGSAPAADGSIYVVGAHYVPFVTFLGPRPAAWLCPSKPGPHECSRVEVTEEE
jgi:hypothetical protein